MEYNNDSISRQEDPGAGTKWTCPQCIKCRFNEIAFCKKYNANRLEVEVDIFNCPSFEPTEKVQQNDASKLLGVDLNEKN